MSSALSFISESEPATPRPSTTASHVAADPNASAATWTGHTAFMLKTMTETKPATNTGAGTTKRGRFLDSGALIIPPPGASILRHTSFILQPLARPLHCGFWILDFGFWIGRVMGVRRLKSCFNLEPHANPKSKIFSPLAVLQYKPFTHPPSTTSVTPVM